MKDPRDVIIEPIVSEKSYALSETGAYTFRVHASASKPEIHDAVEKIFNVSLSWRFFELLSYFGFDAGSFSHASISDTCWPSRSEPSGKSTSRPGVRLPTVTLAAPACWQAWTMARATPPAPAMAKEAAATPSTVAKATAPPTARRAAPHVGLWCARGRVNRWLSVGLFHLRFTPQA